MSGLLRGRWMAGIGVGLVVVTLLAGSIGLLPAAPAGPVALRSSTTVAAYLQVSITVSPPTVTQGNVQTFTAQVSGGLGPFTYVWQNGAPGCPSQPEQSWSCTVSSSGSYTVSVTVSNATGATGSSSQSFSVTSSGNGNGGQGNSNNNNNNSNGSNGFNLSAFGPILFYGVIAGIVVFALLVALTVAVVVIAVTLVRRLPKPLKGSLRCPACEAAAPPGAKFCPACASPLTPGKK